MPLTTQDIATLVGNAQDESGEAERSLLRLKSILRVLAAGELPAGKTADDIGKPGGSEPLPGP